jgi:hypothetical protein
LTNALYSALEVTEGHNRGRRNGNAADRQSPDVPIIHEIINKTVFTRFTWTNYILLYISEQLTIDLQLSIE